MLTFQGGKSRAFYFPSCRRLLHGFSVLSPGLIVRPRYKCIWLLLITRKDDHGGVLKFDQIFISNYIMDENLQLPFFFPYSDIGSLLRSCCKCVSIVNFIAM